MPILSVILALVALLAVAGSASAAIPSPANAQGYVVTNYDEDILLTRRNLDRFYSDRLTTLYTAPGVSWVNLEGGTASACGNIEVEEGRRKAASYCRFDKVVYVNYAFLQELNADFGYDGVAAVFAHEYGHHVQNLLGMSAQSQTVSSELQADCMSGAVMRWLSTVFTQLDRARLSYMFWTVGDDSLGVATGYPHGRGAQRQVAWNAGWNLPDSHFAIRDCLRRY
jgi:predicted metalloprotease